MTMAETKQFQVRMKVPAEGNPLPGDITERGQRYRIVDKIIWAGNQNEVRRQIGQNYITIKEV